MNRRDFFKRAAPVAAIVAVPAGLIGLIVTVPEGTFTPVPPVPMPDGFFGSAHYHIAYYSAETVERFKLHDVP